MHDFKLLLVVPNYNWTSGDAHTFWHIIPYNLCLLAAVVRDRCTVEILDAYAANMSSEAFVAAVRGSAANAVGITVLMDQFAPAGHTAARLTREALPQASVSMGGVYVTMNPALAISDENVDYAFVGEAEETLPMYLDWEMGLGDFPKAGIWRKKDGRIASVSRAPFIENLDALPRPAYDLINFSTYSTRFSRKSVDAPPDLPFARIFTSRGCPVGCCFCQVASIQGKKFRPRSPDNVLDEIEWLKADYGVRALIFDDDNLYTDRKRARALFQGMIDRGLVIPWVSISTAVFKLAPDLVDLMARSGCRYICIAIESGSERVLKTIVGKPVNYSHAKEMTRIARARGIFVAANFIIGFPTETWDEIRETIAFAEELRADYIKLFNAIPLKNTRLWKLCEEHGAFRKGFSHAGTRWNTGQIQTDQFRAEDLTILRAYEWDRINFATADKRTRTAGQMGISLAELEAIRRSTRETARSAVCKTEEPSEESCFE